MKRSEHGIIVDPVSWPDALVKDALEIMERYHISGVLITKDGTLVGILTNRTSGLRSTTINRYPM